jgi:uncharacterized membrane protein (UPF0127 family)
MAEPDIAPDRPKRQKWIVGGIVAAMLAVTAISLFTNLRNGPFSAMVAQAESKAAATGVERLEIVSGDRSHVFQVEVMKTPEGRAKGLMFRQHMAEDRGMLFDFEREEPVAMWMRNTYIPLDMLFIKANGVVHRVHERAQPLDETTIPAGAPVRFVLELNAGVAAKLGIKAGDRVKHGLIR